MSQLKRCDRCEDVIAEANQIGLVVEIKNYVVQHGYIRPPEKLRKVASEGGEEVDYFPLMFTEKPAANFDLCEQCFDDFMKIDKTALSSQS